MIALTTIIMVRILWTLAKSHMTCIIITRNTAPNEKNLITRNMQKNNFWNFFRRQTLIIKTNQPTLLWKVRRKSPPSRQQQQKPIVQIKKKKFLFYITTPPSKWTPEEDPVLSVLGSAEDQGVKVWGRLPTPRTLFAQERGIGGIREQWKEGPFAVNDKCPGGKVRPPRTSPGSVNLQEKRDTISKDRHMSHNSLSASPHHASTKLYIARIQPPKNAGIAGQEEKRKAPFDISGVTNCPSKSLASIILNPQHALGSQSLFAEQESEDESNTTFSKNNDNLEGSTIHVDEDGSLNGGERSSIKETTEIFVEQSSKGEQAASRNLDGSEVEDDWDRAFLHNGDLVEGRVNKTFMQQPSKGEQSPSRNSNQSINRHKNDEIFNPRKVDKHHIDIHPSDLYLNTTSTKRKYLTGGNLFFTNLQELINDPEMRTLNGCLLCQVLYYKVRPQGRIRLTSMRDASMLFYSSLIPHCIRAGSQGRRWKNIQIARQ
jgi:hypothetical protein